VVGFVSTAVNATNVLASLEPIKEGASHLLENSAVLIKVLDELAKLHPFVGGELL